MGHDLQQMAQTLRDTYQHWGYALVFAGGLVESVAGVGLFLPGGLLVIVGAVYAQQGIVALPAVAALGWSGILVGTTVDYLVGRYTVRLSHGSRLMRLVEPRLAAARVRLDRYGVWAPIVAHVLGHPRSYVAMAAGMSGRRYARFLLYELIAASIWTAIFVTAGYTLSNNLGLLKQLMGGAGFLIVFSLISVFVGQRLLAQVRLGRGAAS